MKSRYNDELAEKIKALPKIDVHCHFNLEKPQSQNIGDILFYHFLKREINSAGGDGNFLSSDASLRDKMDHFLEFLPLIKNTGTFWCVKKILKDIYGVDELNKITWKSVQEQIEKTKTDYDWPRKLLVEKLKIEKSLMCGKLWNKEELNRKPYLLPHVEDFGFGVGYLRRILQFKCGENTFPASLKEALDEFTVAVEKNISFGVRSFGFTIEDTFRIEDEQREKAGEIYQKFIDKKELTLEEGNILATKLFYRFLESINGKAAAQLYFSGVWEYKKNMKFDQGESYVVVDHRIIPDFIRVFKDFPGINFSLMYCGEALSQQFTNISRMLPNVSITGFWWHNLFPVYVEKLIQERIEVLPANKWMLVGTDAYNCEWSYGKTSLVLDCLINVLNRKIEKGYFNIEEALSFSKRILYDNAREVYRI
jgi:hypothetical protein